MAQKPPVLAGRAGLAKEDVVSLLTPLVAEKRRVLVVGMGGGCDVCSAYALAAVLHARTRSSGAPPVVFYGNCIGPRPLPEDLVVQVPGACYSFGPETARPPLPISGSAYGTVDIERSMPAAYPDGSSSHGSPLLLIVDKLSLKPSDGDSVAALTRRNNKVLAGVLESLDLDFVIGVDNGGDSLTGGIDFRGSDPAAGRDMQVLFALRAWTAGGVASGKSRQALHVVLGPGCDGESSEDSFLGAVAAADAKNLLVAACPLAGDLVGLLEAAAKDVGPTRTPRIIAEAFRQMQEGRVLVDRSERPLIPAVWLRSALILQVDPEPSGSL